MDQAQTKQNPAEIILILILNKNEIKFKIIGDFHFLLFLKINIILKLEFFQEICKIN